jgi:hypothetical protein
LESVGGSGGFGPGDDRSEISQTFTDLTEGTELELSLDLAQRKNNDQDSDGWEVIWNGTTVREITADEFGETLETFTVNLTAEAGDDTLTLKGIEEDDKNTSGSILDNVTLRTQEAGPAQAWTSEDDVTVRNILVEAATDDLEDMDIGNYVDVVVDQSLQNTGTEVNISRVKRMEYTGNDDRNLVDVEFFSDGAENGNDAVIRSGDGADVFVYGGVDYNGEHTTVEYQGGRGIDRVESPDEFISNDRIVGDLGDDVLDGGGGDDEIYGDGSAQNSGGTVLSSLNTSLANIAYGTGDPFADNPTVTFEEGYAPSNTGAHATRPSETTWARASDVATYKGDSLDVVVEVSKKNGDPVPENVGFAGIGGGNQINIDANDIYLYEYTFVQAGTNNTVALDGLSIGLTDLDERAGGLAHEKLTIHGADQATYQNSTIDASVENGAIVLDPKVSTNNGSNNVLVDFTNVSSFTIEYDLTTSPGNAWHVGGWNLVGGDEINLADPQTIATAGDDELFGGAGNDEIYGGAGDDRIYGDDDDGASAEVVVLYNDLYNHFNADSDLEKDGQNPPDDVASWAYAANGADGFGSVVGFEEDENELSSGSVVMSNWWGYNEDGDGDGITWEEGDTDDPGVPTSGYTHDFTLELYEVDRTNGSVEAGDLIGEFTQEQDVPGREIPVPANASFAGNGTDYLMEWDLGGIEVGQEVLFMVSFDIPDGDDNEEALNQLNIAADMTGGDPLDVTEGVNTDEGVYWRSDATGNAIARFDGGEVLSKFEGKTVDGGDDVLYGQAGDDDLFGGEGNDMFVFSQGDGKDTIADFQVGKDTIDLEAFAFTDGDNDGIARDELDITENSVNSIIELGADQQVTVLNVTGLSDSDFIF